MKTNYILFTFILVLFSCKKDYDPDDELIACFGYQVNMAGDPAVQFTNCSENATHYLWEFGDGTTSTEREPLHNYEPPFPYEVTLNAFRGNEVVTQKQFVYDDIMVYKPNIYVYPTNQIDLCVKLSFPMGGHIVESIPSYNNGWCVNVTPSGRINETYNYLFYESVQPNVFQYNKGWCIGRNDLQEFFEISLMAHNFSQAEINDFIEYWIPLLKEKEFYCIYPQTNPIIDRIIKLDFSVQPDHVNRLFYGIIGADDFKIITPPDIVTFNRSGFYVMEWGVFIN
ncbi:MAG: PKD domain-containing protein [Ignavibacteria bacterium]|nr:PKD domain-containing protein [Ignavibacteria bacterium]